MEEYTEKAKKIIKFFAITTIGLFILIMITENFSWLMIVSGILAQFVHLAILRKFPSIKIISAEFFSAIFLLLLNHYLAFKHFQEFYHTLSEVSSKFDFILQCPDSLYFLDFRILYTLSLGCSFCPVR